MLSDCAKLAMTQCPCLRQGLGGAKDQAVRQFALAQKRTLVTIDSDFSHIVRYRPADTPGVIWLRPRPSGESVSRHSLMAPYASSPIFPWVGELLWSKPAAFAFVEPWLVCSFQRHSHREFIPFAVARNCPTARFSLPFIASGCFCLHVLRNY